MELSRITHQLGKCDLEPKSGFPDSTGSHPVTEVKVKQNVVGEAMDCAHTERTRTVTQST